MNIEKQNNYVYAISKDSMHYIGCRSTDLKPLEDLGIKYFTSSNDTKFKKLFTTRPDLFDLDILGNFKTRKEAMQMEIDQHMIYDVGRNPKFWNRAKATTTGFDVSGTQHSDETKAKIGTANKGMKHTDKAKARMSKSSKKLYAEGFINPMKGKKLSDEHVAKISLANKGKKREPFTDEHRANLSKANKGRVFTDETRKKLSKCKKGDKHPMFGKHHSEKAKEKLSKAHKGKVLSEEHKAKLREVTSGENNPFYDKKHSELTKEKMSKASSNRPKFECEHCGKEVLACHLTRWHGDNCKQNK